MYNEYFGLRETPFSIAPDPRYLYMSEKHREALAHLVYGVGSQGGFVLLTGEVGTGKTTVCRCLLEQIPGDCEVAFVLNPKLSSLELLATICDEFEIARPAENGRGKILIDLINTYLLNTHASGRRAVLIIDEAQNLSVEVLEQLRLLTNLETDRCKLLQVILLAQPEFNDLLARPEMRQLAQRITARYHLGSLTLTELDAYLSHRLQVAGLGSLRRDLFPGRSLRLLHRLSGGIPRLINVLCDRALLGTYVREQSVVTTAILRQAAKEVFGESRQVRSAHRRLPWRGVMAFALVVAGVAFAGVYRQVLVAPPSASSSSLQTPQVEASVSDNSLAEAVPLRWPPDIDRANSEELAFSSLFRLWGLDDSQRGADICGFADQNGLGCLRGRDSLRTLAFLDRPAVLAIYDEAGAPYFATLVATSGAQATLDMGGALYAVDVAELQRRWQGEFTLLWRYPPGYRGVLRRGDAGAPVQWLARKLALAAGEALPEEGTYRFDEKMAARVRAFQLSAGLEPDGLVGARTLVRLNSLTGEAVPVLERTGG